MGGRRRGGRGRTAGREGAGPRGGEAPGGWGPHGQAPPGPGVRGPRGEARPARRAQAAAGGLVGPAVSEGSAGLFRARGGPDSPQEPSARHGKDRQAVRPLRGTAPRDPASPRRGRSSAPCAAWSAPPADCAGGAGSRGHACAARDRAPRGPGRLPRGRGAEGEGCAVDSRESARRGAPAAEGREERGGAWRGFAGRRDPQPVAGRTLCGRRRHSVQKESGRLPSAAQSGRRGDVSESKPMKELAATLPNRRKDLPIKIKYSKSK
ncbi:collagen alpha-1(I) chain [Mustela putorius furo]|uniref:Collagen alpha-1(I) chain n=1 Tax=Mustela putorius furo TaxID=9669 RepID=A0A8U0NHK8_MUSPF|nr:collagen alpha-1(I) chain [Mustela putorius furo]